MAFKHGKNGYFAIDDSGGTERNVSPYVTGVDPNFEIDLPPTTTFGSVGVRRQVVGLEDGTITVSLNHDTTADVGSWTVFTALLGAANSSTFKWGPEGVTGGLPRVTGECRLQSISPPATVDGVVTIKATLVLDDGYTFDTF